MHTLFNGVHLPTDDAKSAHWLEQHRRGCLQNDALFDELCQQQLSVTCLWTIIQQCTSAHKEHQRLMREESPLEAAKFLNEIAIDLSRPILHLYGLRLLAHGTVLFKHSMFCSCVLSLQSKIPAHSELLLSTEQEDHSIERSDDMRPLHSGSNTD